MQKGDTEREDDTGSKLVQYLERTAALDAEFIVWDDGYRGRTYSYRQVAAMANAVRGRLRDAGIGKGDAVLIWSESRPGWVAALWGCLLEGVVAVPVDPQSSRNLVDRIAAKARTKVALIGDRVGAIDGAWRLAEVEQSSAAAAAPAELDLDDVAEIVFTSGTTAEPKGVVITHRNLLANLEPVAQEID
ncbi:MAG: acyl--CoA ligase, partial [Acidobacteriia bacterium]|nr:acyl--CoA ligase [Terriglobia bacterium]